MTSALPAFVDQVATGLPLALVGAALLLAALLGIAWRERT